MRTIWFHIGAPKTGTTSIQDYCRKNQDALAARGIWYPLLDKVESSTGHSRQPSAHHWLAHELRGSNPKHRRKLPTTTAKQFEAVLEEFGRESYPAMLLSSETFVQHSRMFSPANLPSQLSNFDAVAICYIRRSDEFVESLYKTIVAGHGRASASLDWFARRAAPKYPRRLEGFLKVIPSKRVILRSFDENRHRLLEDFLSNLPSGFDDELRARIPDYHKNTALGAKQILFLRRLNALQVSLEDFRAVKRAFRKSPKTSDRFTLMSQERREQLLSSYNEDIKALNEAYGCRFSPVAAPPSSKELLQELTSVQITEMMEELREAVREKTWTRLANALDVATPTEGLRARRLRNRERRLARRNSNVAAP